MSERFSAPEGCTFIFSGDISTTQEMFSRLKGKVLDYEYKADGKKRQHFNINKSTNNSFLSVDIAFMTVNVQLLGIGCVSLTYSCGFERQGWEHTNTMRILKEIFMCIKQLTYAMGYNLVDNCTKGLPFSVVYTKNYEGVATAESQTSFFS